MSKQPALRSSSSRASSRSTRLSVPAVSASGRRKQKDVEADPDFQMSCDIVTKPAAKRVKKSKVDEQSSQVSSLKASQPGSLSSWVSSSFGSTDLIGTRVPVKSVAATSRSKLSTASGSQTGLTWCDKHCPTTVESLAVHRKKVEEVQNWLERIFSSKRGTSAWIPPISLLTGPAGCGKSTTVRVLCKSLHADLHEWQNPNINTVSWKSEYRDDSMPYESEVQCFRDFLLRANKYGSISLKGLEGAGSIRRVLIVEELPNIFYRQPALLHAVLGDYARLGCSPLLFVSSDSPRSDISTAQLFPERVLNQLGINSIHFNPIAQTSLVKCMTRILSEESSGSSLDKSSIEGLAMSSCGDIRSAVNSLQFACRRDTRDLRSQFHAAKFNPPHTSSSKGSAKRSSSSRQSSAKGHAASASSTGVGVAVGGRDVALFLFRALGKVLYCKRDTAAPSDASLLPSHLQYHSRQPIIVQAEDILDHSHLSADMFTLYLHQNYLSFHSDIDSVASASDYLSCSTMLAHDWTSRSLSSQFSGSLSCRSLMFANDGNSSASPGWKPLHKPQWLSAVKERQQRVSSGQVYLLHDRAEKHSDVHSHTALYTELLPAIGKLNLKFMSPDHIAFIHATAHYPGETRHRSRTGLQTLGELDVDDDEENIASSQVLHTSSNAAPSATNPTSAGGAVPEPLSAPDELVALGEDLLTAEDIDAFLDFDDDDTGDAGGAETDVPTGPDQLGDVVEDFSDDDSW